MGIAIIANICDPSNINVLLQDTLYIDNWDSVVHNPVSIYDGGGLLATTLNFLAFSDIVQPTTPVDFHPQSYQFTTAGTFNIYVDGDNTTPLDGTVTVLNPTITAITENPSGDNIDPTVPAANLSFVITGTNFPTTGPAPVVTLTDVTPLPNNNGAFNAINVTVVDSATITGTINGLLPGKFGVQATFGSVSVTPDVNNTAAKYYKGQNNFNIVVSGENENN